MLHLTSRLRSGMATMESKRKFGFLTIASKAKVEVTASKIKNSLLAISSTPVCSQLVLLLFPCG